MNRGLSYSSNESAQKKNHLGGCLIAVLVLVALIVGAIFFIKTTITSTFDKVSSYQINEEKMTLVENDSNMNNYRNIALFGVDDQDNEIKSYGSRTDSIIVASINNKTKEIKLMSIYRDTYVSIDGKYDKINAAHSYGGPELAMSTINRNLDLNVSDFVTVNFKALADAVDAVDGVELTVQSKKELKNLNDYIGNMNKINGGDSPKFESESFPFTATFDGNQAVAYSRIRYMAGGDHARASHQRLVINGLMTQIKKKPWKVLSLVDTVLPQCQTSLSSSDMMDLCMSLRSAKIVDSQAYPFDNHSVDLRYGGIYYGFPLSTATNTRMAHEYLFGTKDYQVSDELSIISQKISWITEDYGYATPE